MDAQDFRSIQEAYMEVVENQQLDELTPATPRNIQRLVTKREKDARKAEDRTGHNFTPEYKKYFRTLKLGKVRSKFDRPASRSVEPASTNEETDLYDIILSHLLDEGYAETEDAAQAIMVNMSEEWRESIVEEVFDEALTGERYKKAVKKPGGTAYSRMVSPDPAKRATRGGRGGESDFGAGDRGSGNKAARRAGTYKDKED
jgi:hypothetical protein